jgi:hypothetical protein
VNGECAACMRQAIRQKSQVGLRNGSRRLRTRAGSLRGNPCRSGPEADVRPKAMTGNEFFAGVTR